MLCREVSYKCSDVSGNLSSPSSGKLRYYFLNEIFLTIRENTRFTNQEGSQFMLIQVFATDDSTMQRIPLACWKTKASETHTEYVIFLPSTWHNGYSKEPRYYVIQGYS